MREPGFGPAGHLIRLLLQASAVSPALWQRGTKSPPGFCKDKRRGGSEKEKANDSREKEKHRTEEVNKPSREPAAAVAGLQSSI